LISIADPKLSEISGPKLQSLRLGDLLLASATDNHPRSGLLRDIGSSLLSPALGEIEQLEERLEETEGDDADALEEKEERIEELESKVEELKEERRQRKEAFEELSKDLRSLAKKNKKLKKQRNELREESAEA